MVIYSSSEYRHLSIDGMDAHTLTPTPAHPRRHARTHARRYAHTPSAQVDGHRDVHTRAEQASAGERGWGRRTTEGTAQGRWGATVGEAKRKEGRTEGGQTSREQLRTRTTIGR
eukprot:GHVU01206258.1.p2 GENE.GHVU01206258.1~~GHVU01206258.1.p2  ORF type:complete len:114 (+),score=11.22 GHVU01206258.1:330-671(+)